MEISAGPTISAQEPGPVGTEPTDPAHKTEHTQKQRTDWTAAVEASYRRSTTGRSQLSPTSSPEPAEPPSPPAGLPESAGGQPDLPSRPLGVHQSAVAADQLAYPSGLHRHCRLMVMAAVTSLCLYRHTAALLPVLSLAMPPLPALNIETFIGGVSLNVL